MATDQVVLDNDIQLGIKLGEYLYARTKEEPAWDMVALARQANRMFHAARWYEGRTQDPRSRCVWRKPDSIVEEDYVHSSYSPMGPFK